ncbi:MAG TPA: TMEM165/GDT1 family protein [Streptosporangiaceae bacterium]
MYPAVALTTFAVVFPAELPDKTALASLMLGNRYRPVYVFAGVAAAFAVHVVLALVAGGLLGLLPHRVLSAVVAALFGVGAVLLFLRRGEDDDVDRATAQTPPTFWRVAAVSFGLIFLAEFGDLTQIVLVNLAARFHDPLAVGTGGLLALWTVAGLAIVGGRGLVRVIPIRLVTLIGAGVMAVLAVISLASAIRGLGTRQSPAWSSGRRERSGQDGADVVRRGRARLGAGGLLRRASGTRFVDRVH